MASDNNVFLLAGAGTGKTRVIVERVKRLIEEGVPEDSILIISFTHKTIVSLKYRLRKYSPVIATFHSLCYKELSLNEKINIVKEAFLIDNGYSKDDLLKIDLLKRNNLTNKRVKQYNKFLHKNNLYDYTDLELKLYDKIVNNKMFANVFKRKYKYIFLDEFQDTSLMQFILLQKMVTNNTSVFCVGDPNQAIYSFRGASKEVIKKYLKIFNATVYYLDLNYRSTYFIIRAANKLMINKSDFNHWLYAVRKEIGSFNVKYFKDTEEQLEFINKSIREYLKHLQQKDIAIIYRSHYLATYIKQYFFTTYYENLNILTIHQAKGLEFEVVYFIGLEEGNLPLYNSDILEERNIFYVGITRAKTHLYLCSVLNYKKPSRFIKECLI